MSGKRLKDFIIISCSVLAGFILTYGSLTDSNAFGHVSATYSKHEGIIAETRDKPHSRRGEELGFVLVVYGGGPRSSYDIDAILSTFESRQIRKEIDKAKGERIFFEVDESNSLVSLSKIDGTILIERGYTKKIRDIDWWLKFITGLFFLIFGGAAFIGHLLRAKN